MTKHLKVFRMMYRKKKSLGNERIFLLQKGVRAIIKDSNLVERQNKLDKMLKDAEERDRVRTHLLPTPNQVSTGIVYKTKKAEIVRLQKILDDVR